MSATETTQAILLRRVRFSESGWVLVWLADDRGKLRTAARSTSRKESGLRGRLDLFHHAEIQFAPSRKSDLHSLREVRLIESWEGISKDYEFSRRTMEEHWDAGYRDAMRAMTHPEVLKRPKREDGVQVFDFSTP